MKYVILQFSGGKEGRELLKVWKPYQVADALAYKVRPNLYELWVPIR